MNDEQKLNQLIANQIEASEAVAVGQPLTGQMEAPTSSPSPSGQLDYAQWQIGPNGIHRPGANTIRKLSPGVYRVIADDHGVCLQSQTVVCDDIVELPDARTGQVLKGMQKFWSSHDKYAKHGLLYKRGLLMFGPPGSGKTVTIQLLSRELIKLGGIVLLCTHPVLLQTILPIIRKIEPDRPLIIIMEDIDEMIQYYSEHAILSVLDGENQISNVVYLATTNYAEKLGARIINRPSRFDERIFVDMPNLASRKAYLKKSAKGLDPKDLELWAQDTNGMSIAHLRELVASVFCLDGDYAEVLGRLKAMGERPKDLEGFTKRKLGLN